jgi:hypothetical protein
VELVPLVARDQPQGRGADDVHQIEGGDPGDRDTAAIEVDVDDRKVGRESPLEVVHLGALSAPACPVQQVLAAQTWVDQQSRGELARDRPLAFDAQRRGGRRSVRVGQVVE